MAGTVAYEYLRAPTAFGIYVVGNLDDTTPIARTVLNGLETTCSGLTVFGVPVRIHSRNDEGDKERARQIADALVASDDAILVIGHMYSDITADVAGRYLSADPALPMFLPTETTPDVGIHSPDYRPVFRFAPSDVQQAQVAAEILQHKGAKRIGIITDSQYPNYAAFIAQELKRRLFYGGTPVLAHYWSNSSSVAPPTLQDLDALDGLMYVGDAVGTHSILAQIRAAGNDRVTIILSDLAADTRLIDANRDLVEGAYVVHSLKASTYHASAYKAVGQDACWALRGLLTEINQTAILDSKPWNNLRRDLKLWSADDVREALGEAMERHVLRREKFDGVQIGDGPYGFNHLGWRDNARFHVWEVFGGKFVDVEPHGSNSAMVPSSRLALRRRPNEETSRQGIRLLTPKGRSRAANPTVLGTTAPLTWLDEKQREVGTVRYSVRLLDTAGEELRAPIHSYRRSLDLRLDEVREGPITWTVTDGDVTSEHGQFDFYRDTKSRVKLTGQVRVGIAGANDGSFINVRDGQVRGLEVQLIEKVVAAIQAGDSSSGNLAVVFFGYPWEQLLSAAPDRDVDILMSRISSDADREHRFDLAPSVPYYRSTQGVATKRGRGMESFSAMRGKLILVPRGTRNESFARTYFVDSTIMPVATVAEALQRLEAGEGDAVIADHVINVDIANRIHNNLVSIPGEDLLSAGGGDASMEYEYYVLEVRHADKWLLSEIDAALCGMHESGELEDLFGSFELPWNPMGQEETGCSVGAEQLAPRDIEPESAAPDDDTSPES